VEEALTGFKHGDQSFGHVAALALLLAAGFTAGSAGLGIIERRLRRTASPPPLAGGSADALLTPADIAGVEAHARRRALETGMVIAAAIGLHNFAEGLAIGVSART